MQTICVQKCKLGSTEYYLAKMPAGELVDTVGLAAVDCQVKLTHFFI